MRTTAARILPLLIGAAAATGVALLAGDAGTPADRETLFRYLVGATVKRTAWSPHTAGRPEKTFEADAGRLRSEFTAADSDDRLFHALVKLSNLRHDRHLSVDLVPGGIQPQVFEMQAPVQFRTDYGTSGTYALFVADVDLRIEALARGDKPAVGDVLESVNGTPISQLARLMEPYIRYSTVNKLWWEIAGAVSKKSWRFGPEVYGQHADVAFGLRRRSGATYVLRVPYLQPDEVQWSGFAVKRYRGFKPVLDTPSFTLLQPELPQKVVILDWKGFVRSAPADTDTLMAFASEKGLLDHDVFFDGTSSGGGSRGAYVLARLAARPFKTTLGNIRVSDVTPRFIEQVKAERRGGEVGETGDAGARLVAWLESDVVRAIREGRAYSPNVPFKLADLDVASGGIMQPAPVHFHGELACAFGPFGGSHLDQFAAMVADNGLGHTIGMPAGGYSNTWEWTETLRFERTGRPVASFMWNIGHTIRPNGEILEGNPALPREPVPVTKDNFLTYHDEILHRALAYFQRVRQPR